MIYGLHIGLGSTSAVRSLYFIVCRLSLPGSAPAQAHPPRNAPTGTATCPPAPRNATQSRARTSMVFSCLRFKPIRWCSRAFSASQ